MQLIGSAAGASPGRCDMGNDWVDTAPRLSWEQGGGGF
jgi:hypothetical protein